MDTLPQHTSRKVSSYAVVGKRWENTGPPWTTWHIYLQDEVIKAES